MYKTWETDQTLEELKLELIREVREDDDRYYVFTSYDMDSSYDNQVSLVDKKTKKVSRMWIMDYMIEDIEDKTSPVEIDRFRKEA